MPDINFKVIPLTNFSFDFKFCYYTSVCEKSLRGKTYATFTLNDFDDEAKPLVFENGLLSFKTKVSRLQYEANFLSSSQIKYCASLATRKCFYAKFPLGMVVKLAYVNAALVLSYPFCIFYMFSDYHIVGTTTTLSPDPCLNGGICVRDENRDCISCNCEVGFIGELCEEALTKINGNITYNSEANTNTINVNRANLASMVSFLPVKLRLPICEI